MNAEAGKQHREAVKAAEQAGKNIPTLMAARLFAFNNGFTWMFYNPIRDEWNGTDGELYSTAAILDDFK